MLGRDESSMNMVACHLGAGASVACIRGGVSIDTSMGLTPLEGCVSFCTCDHVRVTVCCRWPLLPCSVDGHLSHEPWPVCSGLPGFQ